MKLNTLIIARAGIEILICCAQFSCWQVLVGFCCHVHMAGVSLMPQAGHDAAAHWEKHQTRKLDTLATIAAIKKFRNGENTRKAGNAEARRRWERDDARCWECLVLLGFGWSTSFVEILIGEACLK